MSATLRNSDAFRSAVAERVELQSEALCRRTDRMFAYLMVIQWIGAIAAALLITPRTWAGEVSYLHPHFYMAVFLGGLLSGLPICLAIAHPGKLLTRMVIAVSQMLFSCLLIDLTGGRIETHFHVFGSLAFLAVYRDWRVLLPASAIVALDHLVRGIWWPETVFGVIAAGQWRWLEHAGWVIFEDVFLVLSIRQSVAEMRDIATQTTEIEITAHELSEAKDLAEAANKAKSEFLANMSHELRTPLNGILGFTDLLAGEGRDIAEHDRLDYLDTIRRSGKRLLLLLNDLLDLSKIEAGQLKVERIQCSPDTILAEVISIQRVPAQQKSIALDYRWESEIPSSIKSDPHRLYQLLTNLISNAIKFTNEGSVLVVAKLNRDAQPAMLEFEVRDTGIGIPEDKVESIFRPFVQADTSVTRKYGGTGLGLAISRRLAEALGGQLSVVSRLGAGSTFTATVATGDLSHVAMVDTPLPIAAGDIRNHTETNIRLDGVRVLVVDDSETNRKLIARFLEKAGAKIAVAENGEEAVNAAVKQPFDLVLMDMQMPVMDGYTAARMLRTNGFSAPIVAVTAHAMVGDREKCESVGCDGYLSKPVEMDALIRCVRAAVDKKQSPTTGIATSVPATAGSNEIIHSTLPVDDPEIRELVQEFIDKLQPKLKCLEEAIAANDLDTVAKVAHTIKGAGGTAGFRCLTAPASTLEQLAKGAAERAKLQSSLDDLRHTSLRISV